METADSSLPSTIVAFKTAAMMCPLLPRQHFAARSNHPLFCKPPGHALCGTVLIYSNIVGVP
jgi:hypothetical protein